MKIILINGCSNKMKFSKYDSINYGYKAARQADPYLPISLLISIGGAGGLILFLNSNRPE